MFRQVQRLTQRTAETQQSSRRIVQDMDLLLFIGIALLVLLVIVACVVVKAWHVANENPVKSIKAE